MRSKILAVATLLASITVANAQYMGNWTANRYLPPAPPQPPNTYNNPYGNSMNSPRLYDSEGNYHGNLNNNQYDPDSVANPYGRYGSRYSNDSVNNPYSQSGSQYGQDSPNNPYSNGMRVYGPTTP
jgi:hypothetical protein